MSEQKSKHPNPMVECPNCTAKFRGTSKLRVRDLYAERSPDYRVLERFYLCSCGYEFWHEVKAKEIPE